MLTTGQGSRLRRATVARTRAEHRWEGAVIEAARSGASSREIARAASTSEATVLRVLRRQPSHLGLRDTG
jgi:DNA-binding NarL/FixJ family response regulator